MDAITDGGLETTLIYHAGAELPHFAAFVLLEDEAGLRKLRDYYRPYVAIARAHGVRAILDTPTWRASADWGALLGYTRDALADVNRRAVDLLCAVRSEAPEVEIAISGCIGPRGDGYVVGKTMSADEAAEYHAPQAEALAGADLITALTLTYAEEAIGIARASAFPPVISFTVETDGRLPSGQPLAEAIAQVDAEADVAYFMVNCAHPTHFRHVLDGSPELARIEGIRANASALSHEELDASVELDEGDPEALACEVAELRGLLPGLRIAGGCCGTDGRHVATIAAALTP
jgi:S-methylmethionine-dependent homocysteine/selenocysteine methylase